MYFKKHAEGHFTGKNEINLTKLCKCGCDGKGINRGDSVRWEGYKWRLLYVNVCNCKCVRTTAMCGTTALAARPCAIATLFVVCGLQYFK